MKLLAILFVLTFMIASALAMQNIVCPPNFCADKKCENNPKTQGDCDKEQALDPQGKFVLTEKASICGCCSLCIRILKEGQDCLPHFHGPIIRSRCDEGLECVSRTHKCEPLRI